MPTPVDIKVANEAKRLLNKAVATQGDIDALTVRHSMAAGKSETVKSQVLLDYKEAMQKLTDRLFDELNEVNEWLCAITNTPPQK